MGKALQMDAATSVYRCCAVSGSSQSLEQSVVSGSIVCTRPIMRVKEIKGGGDERRDYETSWNHLLQKKIWRNRNDNKETWRDVLTRKDDPKQHSITARKWRNLRRQMF